MTYAKRMRIDGKAIAHEIFEDLTKRVGELKKKNIVPHLVIILLGENPASVSYVKQKELKAQEIGAQATIVRLPAETSEEKLLTTIEQFNNDKNVHGIIVQRPLPKTINGNKINTAVSSSKDIDAFRKDSPRQMPLALAVLEIIKNIYSSSERRESRSSETQFSTSSNNNFGFVKWLQSMNIVVIGKGETGGGPTIEMLKNLGADPKVIDSKTQSPDDLLKQADLIVSTVGKPNVITSQNIKQGVILIGVGMHRGEDSKLHADYDEEDIKDIASHYTPVPGGVGPVNVAMLLKNLMLAAENS